MKNTETLHYILQGAGHVAFRCADGRTINRPLYEDSEGKMYVGGNHERIPLNEFMLTYSIIDWKYI